MSQMEALRAPPHSIEAEQAVLGGLMLDPRALPRIVDVLTRTASSSATTEPCSRRSPSSQRKARRTTR
jgi:hypothetical protein